MITRDFQIKTVIGIDNAAYDASCEGGSVVTGRIIDRLNLGRHYLSAAPMVIGDGDIGTSTAACHFASVEAKIQHSSTTCGDDFSDFSTGFQAAARAGFVITNTTSTETRGSGFLSTGSPALSTSTGAFSIQTDPAAYDLTAAQRYLRMGLTPHLGASSSGGPVARLTGLMVFGSADELPHNTTSTAREVLTT